MRLLAHFHCIYVKREITHNHGKAIRHGDQVCATTLRALLLEVAQHRGAQEILSRRHAVLVVLQAKLASILADNSNILPAKSLKSLPGNLAKRRREVDEVDAREEFGDVDVLLHGFNVPAGAAANLDELV
jgi:hypothetical protein